MGPVTDILFAARAGGLEGQKRLHPLAEGKPGKIAPRRKRIAAVA